MVTTALAVAAVLEAFFTSGIFDQNPPHRLGCRCEEMPPVIPLLFRRLPYQTQIGFMHEGGCGQCLAGGLVGEFLSRQPLEFSVDDGEQLIGGGQIPSFE
jgi:hypothetical protein